MRAGNREGKMGVSRLDDRWLFLLKTRMERGDRSLENVELRNMGGRAVQASHHNDNTQNSY